MAISDLSVSFPIKLSKSEEDFGLPVWATSAFMRRTIQFLLISGLGFLLWHFAGLGHCSLPFAPCFCQLRTEVSAFIIIDAGCDSRSETLSRVAKFWNRESIPERTAFWVKHSK
ncbi:predicted protein [Coccidioides posadasii str. Silveira]|uniref:Predicted protein n=1 Tax=Coccidioides posadasii (strain RMSCC 757 / Silveira) TaxID=443226 RepID=E9D7Y2_COCPS|nr:predicted protein [Coccidioides posadasii str. Silveira]